MGIAAKHIDRLLPRHESATSLDLDWNVRIERVGRFKKGIFGKGEEISGRASILDISLEGALIATDKKHAHETGEKVPVRFRGLDGVAVIRHCRPGDDETLLYGVSFLPDPVFNEAIDEAVGQIRGHASELARAWKRPN